MTVDYDYRAALASRTVFTMLPSSPHVQEVYTGPNSILSALNQIPPPSESEKRNLEYAQTLCIDSTTLDVDVGTSLTSFVLRD